MSDKEVFSWILGEFLCSVLKTATTLQGESNIDNEREKECESILKLVVSMFDESNIDNEKKSYDEERIKLFFCELWKENHKEIFDDFVGKLALRGMLQLERKKFEYNAKPLNIMDVQGFSSKVIFRFMKNGSLPEGSYAPHPRNVFDWENNRALLLCYPEWKERLDEMKEISPEWKIIITNWNKIEYLYNIVYESNKTLYPGSYMDDECNKLIEKLLKESENRNSFDGNENNEVD